MREMENARLEKIERLGVNGALVDDMLLCVTDVDWVKKGRAYLATLSDDSD